MKISIYQGGSKNSLSLQKVQDLRPKKKIVVFQMTLRKKSGSVGREKLFFFFFCFLKEQQFRGFQNYV